MEHKRNGTDRSNITGHVVTGGTIASCGAAHKLVVLIKQAHRYAIEFQFTGVSAGWVMPEQISNTACEVLDFLGAVGVRKREHRNVMHRRGKKLLWFSADTLRWGFRGG